MLRPAVRLRRPAGTQLQAPPAAGPCAATPVDAFRRQPHRAPAFAAAGGNGAATCATGAARSPSAASSRAGWCGAPSVAASGWSRNARLIMAW